MRLELAGLVVAGLLVGCNQPSGKSSSTATGGEETGVILLRYNQGSESTEQREQGFIETLAKEYPSIPVLSSDQYAGTTPESSLDKAQQMLDKYRGRVTGVFSVCEPNAMGMLGAIEEMNLGSKVKFVGFDPTPRLVDAIAAGTLNGLVLQDPVNMGYVAVKTIVAHLDGEQVKKRIPTGEYLATRENMDTEEMKRLLNPEQFSGEEFQPADAKYVIAVIPKGTTHEFWKSVHAGARNAARELGNVDIRWKGPLEENDRDGQIKVMEDFITQKVSGICLAPLDAQSLVDVVRQAKDKGIPTVIFDSDLADDEAKVSYVATDNYAGGALAARCLAEALGAKRTETSASP
jgi:ABC-type sugar transport system substrate-binding protein